MKLQQRRIQIMTKVSKEAQDAMDDVKISYEDMEALATHFVANMPEQDLIAYAIHALIEEYKANRSIYFDDLMYNSTNSLVV
jgi:hypothetical protein